MSANEEENRLDRVIVYLTLERVSFRLADVVRLLKEQGVEVDTHRVNSSLERLVVGYLLKEHNIRKTTATGSRCLKRSC